MSECSVSVGGFSGNVFWAYLFLLREDSFLLFYLFIWEKFNRLLEKVKLSIFLEICLGILFHILIRWITVSGFALHHSQSQRFLYLYYNSVSHHFWLSLTIWLSNWLSLVGSFSLEFLELLFTTKTSPSVSVGGIEGWILAYQST